MSHHDATFASDNRPRVSTKHRGHVESYFWRANHPHEGKAFWLKATILRPPILIFLPAPSPREVQT